MRNFLIRWFINAVALWVAVELVGIEAARDVTTFAVVALIFGLVNALIRPILKSLTCPLIVLTLGLFTLVINALMLMLTSWLASQLNLVFAVEGFGQAFVGALIVSVVSFILSLVIREEDD